MANLTGIKVICQEVKLIRKDKNNLIVALKKSYDEEKISSDTISTKGSANRVSKGLKVSIRTVRNILSEYKKTDQVNLLIVFYHAKSYETGFRYF